MESETLGDILSPNLVNIYHIGSTAVPGLMAKPVIDIMLSVQSLNILDQQSQKIASLDYEVMGEFGMPGRRYFRKGLIDRTHQIHAFVQEDHNITRHLAFRDYLRNHPDIAAEYGILKKQLAELYPSDIIKYGDGKEDFITIHEKKAMQWFTNHI